MNTISIASFLSDSPTLSESLGFIVLGFSVVLFTLALLWACTSLAGSYFIKKEKKDTYERHKKIITAAVVASFSEPGNPLGAQGGGNIPSHILAVISAAVDSVIDEPYRMISVSVPINSPWAREARMSQMSNHPFRR